MSSKYSTTIPKAFNLSNHEKSDRHRNNVNAANSSNSIPFMKVQ